MCDLGQITSPLGALVSTSDEWARGIQIPPVLSPERLPGKLTLVQMQKDTLGVIQLSGRGNGAPCTCPVEDLDLGSEDRQLCDIDS